jgi:hypothetical protein
LRHPVIPEDREPQRNLRPLEETMSAHLRQGTDPNTIHPRTATPKAGARTRRLAAILASVTTALMASVVAVPAAFATVIRPAGGPDGPSSVAPVRACIVRMITGGTPGWQIALIALGAALLGAAAATMLQRGPERKQVLAEQ